MSEVKFEIDLDHSYLSSGDGRGLLFEIAVVAENTGTRSELLADVRFELVKELLIGEIQIPLDWPRLDDWRRPVIDDHGVRLPIELDQGIEVHSDLNIIGGYALERGKTQFGVTMSASRATYRSPESRLEYRREHQVWPDSIRDLPRRCFIRVWFSVSGAQAPSSIDIAVPYWNLHNLAGPHPRLRPYRRPAFLKRAWLALLEHMP